MLVDWNAYEWTHRAVFVVPISLVDAGVAQRLGRCFDPDIGGAASFDSMRAGPDGTATHAVCDVLITEGTASMYPQLQAAGPGALWQFCQQDHADRWPGIEPPSLNDCTQFLDQAQIVIEPRGQRTLDSILQELGLAVVVAPEAP